MTELEKSKAIIQYIADAKKTTPVELYTDEEIKNSYSCKVIGKDGLKVVFGDWEEIEKIINENNLTNYYLKNDRRNSGVPMLDIKNIYICLLYIFILYIIYSVLLDKYDYVIKYLTNFIFIFKIK